MRNDLKEGLKAIAAAFPPPKGLAELGGALRSPFAPMANIIGAGQTYSTLQAWEDSLPSTLTKPEIAEGLAEENPRPNKFPSP